MNREGITTPQQPCDFAWVSVRAHHNQTGLSRTELRKEEGGWNDYLGDAGGQVVGIVQWGVYTMSKQGAQGIRVLIFQAFTLSLTTLGALPTPPYDYESKDPTNRVLGPEYHS